VLVGEEVATGREGDLVVVPPRMAHAFAASAGHSADLLIVITPGVERFEYFRHLGRIAAGQAARESLLEVQDRYDTHFLSSDVWRAARTGQRRRGCGQLRSAAPPRPKTVGPMGEGCCGAAPLGGRGPPPARTRDRWVGAAGEDTRRPRVDHGSRTTFTASVIDKCG
jgi:hypothetical protein